MAGPPSLDRAGGLELIMVLEKRKGASGLVLTVFIWTVVSVLGTRLYQAAAGYPTIGRGQWHVAHMLFGGIIMVTAMMIELIFTGDKLKKWVAAIFGLGWGLFIDEVGKFITRDNNYWFRPAPMIIYISMIILFLIYKYLERKNTEIRVKSRISRALSKTVDKIIKRKVVMVGLWTYSIYYSAEKIIEAIRIITSPEKMVMVEKYYRNYSFFGRSDIYLISFKIVFDLVAAFLFLAGAGYFWSKRRNRGIRFFKYGLYISILLGSIVKFYFEQFGAVVDVALSLVVLGILGEYQKQA